MLKGTHKGEHRMSTILDARLYLQAIGSSEDHFQGKRTNTKAVESSLVSYTRMELWVRGPIQTKLQWLREEKAPMFLIRARYKR